MNGIGQTQNDDDDDDDEDEEGGSRQCPYCGGEGCRHLLLCVDVDFGSSSPAVGGHLFHAFNKAWDRFVASRGDDDFDPEDQLRDLLDEVDGIASYSASWEDDNGPMGCWGYKAFYLDSREKMKGSIKKFQSASEAWRKRWPDGNSPRRRPKSR